MDQTSENSELLLQAHLYLTDELSGTEQAEFEDRLASDLKLQEALADIVMVHHSLRSVTPLTLELQNQIREDHDRNNFSGQTTRRATSWGAIFTTAAALFVIVYSGVLKFDFTASHQQSEVVSESGNDQKTEDIDTLELWTLMSGQDQDTASQAEENSNSTVLETKELDVPDWMFAAVAADINDDEMDRMEDGGTL